MRIVVMGAGGIGAYYGAHLARSGQQVTFIARGAHLAAIRARGLRLAGPRGELHVNPARATGDPAEARPADAVLFCVKLYDVEAAGAALKPLMGPETFVVCTQNGVDGPERLARILGPERVLPGAAYVAAHVAEPGVVRYSSDMSSLVFGEPDGRMSERALRFRDACRAAGFGCEVSADIAKTLWTKLVLLGSNAGMTCLTRQPVGVVYGDPELRALGADAMREVAAVARARGVALDEDVVEKTLELTDGFPPQMTTSMHNDLKRGGRLELEHLAGFVAREADRLGVPAPVNRAIYAALKPWRDGPPPAA
jgi:2-dehydropantoate 2-reductase